MSVAFGTLLWDAALAEHGRAGRRDGPQNVWVGGVRDDRREVRDRRPAIPTVDAELLVIGEQEAIRRVLEHLVVHLAVIRRGGEHRTRAQVDAARAEERLGEQQRLEKADACGPGEAVVEHVEIAAGGERRDLGVAGEALEHVDHVRRDDEALVARRDEVCEVGVRARDIVVQVKMPCFTMQMGFRLRR